MRSPGTAWPAATPVCTSGFTKASRMQRTKPTRICSKCWNTLPCKQMRQMRVGRKTFLEREARSAYASCAKTFCSAQPLQYMVDICENNIPATRRPACACSMCLTMRLPVQANIAIRDVLAWVRARTSDQRRRQSAHEPQQSPRVHAAAQTSSKPRATRRLANVAARKPRETRCFAHLACRKQRETRCFAHAACRKHRETRCLANVLSRKHRVSRRFCARAHRARTRGSQHAKQLMRACRLPRKWQTSPNVCDV